MTTAFLHVANKVDKQNTNEMIKGMSQEYTKKKLLTLYELSETLGVPVESLQALARQGRLKKVIKIGRRWYITTDAVDDIIENGIE